MNLHASVPPARPKSAKPSHGNERSGMLQTTTAAGPPITDATNKVTKPKWKSKWTRGQFLLYSYRPSSLLQRQEPHASGSPGKIAGAADTMREQSTSALPAVRPSVESFRPEAREQTAAENENTDSLLCLQTNGASPEPPRHPSPTSARDTIKADEAAQRSTMESDTFRFRASTDNVPRSFDYTDLTLDSSDDSDQEMAADSPDVPAGPAVVNSERPVSSLTESSTSGYGYSSVSPATRNSVSTASEPRNTIHIPDNDVHREIIFIESSEGSVGSDYSGDSESDDSGSDYASCSPIRRLTLAESSSDIPTTEPPRTSVEEDVWSLSPKTLPPNINTFHAGVDIYSSEDNIPLAVLRRNRRMSKRRPSDDEATEFAIVNRPAPAARPSATTARLRRNFDSNAFDVMIYSQSQMEPPRYVSIPRPDTASSTMSGGPYDDMRFISANPAIHLPVLRSEKWWKDKAREIRSRPSRKKWFGKVTERMRWLQKKELEEETKRLPQTRGSAGRKTRQDPTPAGYKRVMDFGDIPEYQLPAEVLGNPAWVKACEWMRNNREEDKTMQRVVEHRTQMTWQHYENVLKEDG